MSNQVEYVDGDNGQIKWVVKGKDGKTVSESSGGFVNLRAAMDDYQKSLVSTQPVADTKKGKKNAPSGSISTPDPEIQKADADTSQGGAGGSQGLDKSAKDSTARHGDSAAEMP